MSDSEQYTINYKEKWNTEQIVEFTKEYRKRSELWDPTHDLYSSLKNRTIVLHQLADTLGFCDAFTLRKQIKKYQKIYRCRVRKGRVVIPDDKWWFDALESDNCNSLGNNKTQIRFKYNCKSQIEPRKPEPSLQITEDENNDSFTPVSTYFGEDTEDNEDYEILTNNSTANIKHEKPNDSNAQELINISSNQNKSKDSGDEGNDLPKKRKFKESDENDMFGELIASKLIKMPRELKLRTEKMISDILFKGQMNLLDLGNTEMLTDFKDQLNNIGGQSTATQSPVPFEASFPAKSPDEDNIWLDLDNLKSELQSSDDEDYEVNSSSDVVSDDN